MFMLGSRGDGCEEGFVFASWVGSPPEEANCSCGQGVQFLVVLQ